MLTVYCFLEYFEVLLANKKYILTECKTDILHTLKKLYEIVSYMWFWSSEDNEIYHRKMTKNLFKSFFSCMCKNYTFWFGMLFILKYSVSFVTAWVSYTSLCTTANYRISDHQMQNMINSLFYIWKLAYLQPCSLLNHWCLWQLSLEVLLSKPKYNYILNHHSTIHIFPFVESPHNTIHIHMHVTIVTKQHVR